jgi:adenosine deaminase
VKSDPERRQLLHSLPKVALHRHLEGSLRLDTLVEIAHQDGLDVPARTVEEMRSLVTMANRQADQRTYLRKFQVLRLFHRSPKIIWRFAYEVVADAAADNVRYLELRFTPRALAQVRGFPLAEVTDWVCDAVEHAVRDYGVKTRLILSMNRHERLEIGETIAQMAVDRKDKGVVGLDLAGYEMDFPAKPFGSLFAWAKQAGLGITIHAGEWTGPKTVRDAIENLAADRVGHGVRVVEDASVARLARDRGIVFEVCPSSNVQSGVVCDISQHPLRDMFSLNLLTTINTDNTCVSAVTLTDEMENIMDGLGFSLRDIKAMLLNAAQAAFLPEEERQPLLEQFKKELTDVPDEL